MGCSKGYVWYAGHSRRTEAGSIAFYLKLSDEFCAHGQAVTGSEGMLHVRCSSAGRIFSMQK